MVRRMVVSHTGGAGVEGGRVEQSNTPPVKMPVRQQSMARARGLAHVWLPDPLAVSVSACYWTSGVLGCRRVPSRVMRYPAVTVR